MCTCSASPGEARRRAGLVIVALALVTGAAARLSIRCPIRAILGIDCPGCGGTRALAALLRGDVRQAAQENAAALAAGVAMAGYVIAPAQAVRAAATVREAAARHRATRWWARHPQAAACLAAGLWCAGRNGWRLAREARRPVS